MGNYAHTYRALSALDKLYPIMPFEFAVVGLTNALRCKLAPTVAQKPEKPDLEPAASYRRGFQLSIFNILKTRAVEQDLLQPKEAQLLGPGFNTHLRLNLPFAELGLDESEWEDVQNCAYKY